MHRFVDSNPGLRSRFNKYFHFPDYDGENLFKILQRFCQANRLVLHPDLTEVQKNLYQQAMEAYRNRNLPALRLVYDLLNSEVAAAAAAMPGPMRVSDGSEASAEGFARDHSLAAEIYAASSGNPEYDRKCGQT